jgi:HD-GYP domain-containing protein (c-di-GMP phosphodiesterase class II)
VAVIGQAPRLRVKRLRGCGHWVWVESASSDRGGRPGAASRWRWAATPGRRGAGGDRAAAGRALGVDDATGGRWRSVEGLLPGGAQGVTPAVDTQRMTTQAAAPAGATAPHSPDDTARHGAPTTDATGAPDRLDAARRPIAPTAPTASRTGMQVLLDGWERETRQFAALLRDGPPDAAWLARFEASCRQQAALATGDPDTALYVLLQAAVSAPDRYSAHHSMLCAVAGELCARQMQWPDAERAALQRAALSMNVAMAALQDTLARQSAALSRSQREQVEAHAERGAAMLAYAGVGDALWLDTVRWHHGRGRGAAPAAGGADGAQRLAHLLQRVDVYTAKLSRRVSREPMSPALAARQACLDERQRPDALGATLLRAVGVYPPGCCVTLANGETGIVIRRGARAHTPVVAALRRADGGLFVPPVRRDTAQAKHAITMGLPARELHVHLDHLRTLMCG